MIKEKAQNPQNTNACAMPAIGRSRTTFDCSKTSEMKSQTRLPTGASEKEASGFAARMVWTTVRKRIQNEYADAASSKASRIVSSAEGSATVIKLT